MQCSACSDNDPGQIRRNPSVTHNKLTRRAPSDLCHVNLSKACRRAGAGRRAHGPLGAMGHVVNRLADQVHRIFIIVHTTRHSRRTKDLIFMTQVCATASSDSGNLLRSVAGVVLVMVVMLKSLLLATPRLVERAVFALVKRQIVQETA